MTDGEIDESLCRRRWQGGAGAEWVRKQEDKVLGLVAYKELVRFFFWFLHHFHFNKFCRTHYFEFLNSVLTKNLEMDSSFV
jgi:hypothetical protein